ncbi:MAG: ABC transporter permease [Protaetiibacter sp.]
MLTRLLHSLPVLVLVSVLVFGLTLLIPGDPVTAMLGPGNAADPQAVEALRERLRLNDPIPVQYAAWLASALKGDFGSSIVTGEPVLDALVYRLPITLELAVLSTIVAVIVAVPTALFAATRKDSGWDTSISALGTLGLAFPNFWIAVLLVLLFAVGLRWLPASGYVPFAEDPGGHLIRLIMPVIALAMPVAAVMIRQLRNSTIEVLGTEHIRAARAKGVPERRLLARHVIPNATIAPLTILGVDFISLLGGSLAIETIFRIPGIGSYFVDAVFTRDLPVVQGGALVFALVAIVINLVVDVISWTIDPRISRG